MLLKYSWKISIFSKPLLTKCGLGNPKGVREPMKEPGRATTLGYITGLE